MYHTWWCTSLNMLGHWNSLLLSALTPSCASAPLILNSISSWLGIDVDICRGWRSSVRNVWASASRVLGEDGVERYSGACKRGERAIASRTCSPFESRLTQPIFDHIIAMLLFICRLDSTRFFLFLSTPPIPYSRSTLSSPVKVCMAVGIRWQ